MNQASLLSRGNSEIVYNVFEFLCTYFYKKKRYSYNEIIVKRKDCNINTDSRVPVLLVFTLSSCLCSLIQKVTVESEEEVVMEDASCPLLMHSLIRMCRIQIFFSLLTVCFNFAWIQLFLFMTEKLMYVKFSRLSE